MSDATLYPDPADTQSRAEAEAASARGDWQSALAAYARLLEGANPPSGLLLVAWAQTRTYTGAFFEAL